MSDEVVDPFLVLLRRHEAANSTYYAAVDRNASEAERDHLYAECERTMRAIIDHAPAVATGEGAVAALDHVLNDETLDSDYPVDVFLRQLIEAARDYIVRSAVQRGERKFIWPLAATLMLVVLAWALATDSVCRPSREPRFLHSSPKFILESEQRTACSASATMKELNALSSRQEPLAAQASPQRRDRIELNFGT
jgi:hypothetical protein